VCFSAEADIVTGVIVTVVGIDALRHVGHGRESAMAALPILFGLHQLIEVPVWWGLDGGVSAGLAYGAAWLYLAIAFGVIPWAVPLAVRHLEVDQKRRALMAPLLGLGLVVAAVLMFAIVTNPIVVLDGGNHLDYSASLAFGGPIVALYVIATCGALLMSSDRVAVIQGGVNLIAVATLAVLLSTGVISLWCLWAAVTSIAIAIHLRRIHRPGPKPALRFATG
jgi:hypothetical protein